MSKEKSTFGSKTKNELVKILSEKKTALQSFRLGNSRGKTKNVKEGKSIRKEIAQILTSLKVVTK